MRSDRPNAADQLRQPHNIFSPPSLASSLFRPRRFTQVDGGVFLLLVFGLQFSAIRQLAIDCES